MQKILPFYLKFLTCLLAGLVAGAAVRRIGVRFLTQWVPTPAILAVVGLILLLALVYPLYWCVYL